MKLTDGEKYLTRTKQQGYVAFIMLSVRGFKKLQAVRPDFPASKRSTNDTRKK